MCRRSEYVQEEKMNKLFKKPLWIALTSVLAVLLAVFIAAICVMYQYRLAVNSFFDITTSVPVNKPDADIDAEYFKSEYDDDEELWYSTEEYCGQVVAEGSVLLWNNENALPLAKYSKVSCFSHSSVDIIYSGTGSASFSWTGAPTLRDALEDSRFKVNDTLWNFYGKQERRTQLDSMSAGSITGIRLNETPWDKVQSSCQSSFGEYSDAAIVVLARSGGEGSDMAWGDNAPNGTNGTNDALDNNYLELTQEEIDMLDYLTGPTSEFKEVILVINSANGLQFKELSKYRDKIGACLWIGTPGYSGIYAVGELLVGTANPSGRLVDTFCYDNTTAPSLANSGVYEWGNYNGFVGNVNTKKHYGVYQEGIYVGYRYYETRYEDVVLNQGNAGEYDYANTVIFPFGYGNSYTTFEYSNFDVKKNSSGNYDVTLTVTNTGEVRGANTVQIYLQKPYTAYDITHGIEKPSVELAGFTKTRTLRPGKSEIVTIEVTAETFRTYDDDSAKTYILEEGDYYIAFGTDAHLALNNILAKKSADGIAVNTAKMTSAGNADFVGKIHINENDFTTYSENGKIANRLGYADVNKYEGTSSQKITYLTRNNWTGTLPTTSVILTMNAIVAEDLKWNKPVEEDPDAKMPEYDPTVPLNLADLIGKDYDDEAWELLLNKLSFEDMAKLEVEGYCATVALDSITKPQSKESDGALGIGSTYARPSAYRAMGWPCEPILAATYNVELIEEVGQLYGEDMLHSKVAGIYSPGLNIHRNMYNGRNFEYYSEDPFLTGKCAAAQVRGIQSIGCYVFMKHFAINEFETTRHGVATFADEQTIRELYLRGFEIAVKEAEATGLMSSYNRIGCKWTGGSKELQTEILRDEWGFVGMVITDYGSDVDGIYNYVDGVVAGIDKSFNSGVPYDFSNYRENATVVQALRRAAHNVLYVVANSHAMNGYVSDTEMMIITPWWFSALLACIIVTAILLVASAVMLVLTLKIKFRPVVATAEIPDGTAAAENEEGGKTDEK